MPAQAVLWGINEFLHGNWLHAIAEIAGYVADVQTSYEGVGGTLSADPPAGDQMTLVARITLRPKRPRA